MVKNRDDNVDLARRTSPQAHQKYARHAKILDSQAHQNLGRITHGPRTT